MPTVAAPATEAGDTTRRDNRYRLLGGLWRTIGLAERCYTANDGAKVWIRDNTLTQVRSCRRKRLPDQRPGVAWDSDQAHHFGVNTCGSIWSCPVCSAKIRHHRTEEVRAILRAHLAEGGKIGFVTLTLSHRKGQQLAELLDAVADTWRTDVIAGRAWVTLSRTYGINFGEKHSPTKADPGRMVPIDRIGLIRALETKYSTNGHHPHLHVYVLYHDSPLIPGLARDEIRRHITGKWRAGMADRGYRVGSRVGVLWQDITLDNVDTLAAYGCKVQDGTDTLALEITSPDTKNAKGKARSGRGMFDLLASWVVDGDVEDGAIWLEYERATKGRQSITFGRGLRERFGVEVKTDEDLAEEKVGGENAYWYDDQEWTWVRQSTDHLTAIHHAATEHGYLGIIDYFQAHLGRFSGGMDPRAAHYDGGPPTLTGEWYAIRGVQEPLYPAR